ncbi:hypothetical protein TNCV_3653601 [Trichonephila clavipes]|nr:hypothetical protein TNCV_3653601 [Trichonephila clavipes]
MPYEGTIQTSMSSPGLEPRPNGTAASFANHYTGRVTKDRQPMTTRTQPISPSNASETTPKITPPCHILPTNQETLSHKSPSIPGLNNQQLK